MSSNNDIQLEIISYIKNYIKKNKLAEGSIIPSANTIADKFGVNRNTVRNALAFMVAQGILYSQQGKGFFVKKKSKPIIFEHDNGMGFSEILGHGTRNYQSGIIRYNTIPANEKLSKYLDIDEGAPVHVLKVLRKLDGEPFAICTSYLPDSRLPDFGSHLLNFSSVNKIIMDDYKYDHPKCLKIRLEAESPSPEDISYLEIPGQVPILKQYELFEVPGVGPIEYFCVRARGDRFSFKMSFNDE